MISGRVASEAFSFLKFANAVDPPSTRVEEAV